MGSSGVRLLPDATIRDFEGALDTLLVAGGTTAGDTAQQSEVKEWLRKATARARRYGSVCSGAFVLAAAGLLDGLRVTTHWNAAEQLAAEYPRVRVEADHIFLRDGRLYTSAGVTSGMDLALAMVEEDFGRDLALKVARELVMFLKRPGGQSQFSAHLAAQMAERTAIQGVQSWVLANLAAENTVATLARRAGMSPRNFARVFRAEVGRTPAEFVEAARIDAARRLLEETNHSLKQIAATCGFSNVNSMRRAFLRQLAVIPADYRRRFQQGAVAESFARDPS